MLGWSSTNKRIAVTNAVHFPKSWTIFRSPLCENPASHELYPPMCLVSVPFFLNQQSIGCNAPFLFASVPDLRLKSFPCLQQYVILVAYNSISCGAPYSIFWYLCLVPGKSISNVFVIFPNYGFLIGRSRFFPSVDIHFVTCLGILFCLTQWPYPIHFSPLFVIMFWSFSMPVLIIAITLQFLTCSTSRVNERRGMTMTW